MASCVTQLQLAVEEVKDLVDQANRLLDEQVQILKVYADLYMELTDKTAERSWISERIDRAERERARLRLPIWFWRPPDHGKKLQAALVVRATQLHEDGYLEDDIFDLLKEYVAHLGLPALPDRQVASIVKFTRRTSAGATRDANAEGRKAEA
jgi:hypothetical protein